MIFFEWSTEPDIGLQFISQFHSNKFAENKHAEIGSLFQHVLKLSFANFSYYSVFVLRSVLQPDRGQDCSKYSGSKNYSCANFAILNEL